MTTKESVREKVISLLDEIRPHLEKKLDYLLDNDSIMNYQELEDNWKPAKEIAQALTEEMKFQYSNIYATRKDKQRIKKYYYAIRCQWLYNL